MPAFLLNLHILEPKYEDVTWTIKSSITPEHNTMYTLHHRKGLWKHIKCPSQMIPIWPCLAAPTGSLRNKYDKAIIFTFVVTIEQLLNMVSVCQYWKLRFSSLNLMITFSRPLLTSFKKWCYNTNCKLCHVHCCVYSLIDVYKQSLLLSEHPVFVVIQNLNF